MKTESKLCESSARHRYNTVGKTGSQEAFSVWGSVVPEHELQLVFPSLCSLIFQYSLNYPHNWEETLAWII